MIFIKFGKAPQQDNTVQRLRFGLQPGSFGCVLLRASGLAASTRRKPAGSRGSRGSHRPQSGSAPPGAGDRGHRTRRSPCSCTFVGRQDRQGHSAPVTGADVQVWKRQSGANLGCGSEGAQTSSDDGKRQGADGTAFKQGYMNKSGGIPNISRTSGSTPGRLCPVASLMRLQDTSTFWEGLVVNPARHPASMMSVRWN